ncbi:MAG: histidine phosphatase family protein [Alphaproteobacteria bacterium]|nr:histidine phosphatase family protein [Alphaproteobacteria bacterium]
MNKSSFYFMRHGQTDWNAQQLLMGQKDIPLNNLGKEQAKKTIQKVRKLNIQTIYTSPLKRAFETAQIIATALNINLIIIEDLKEAHFGLHEGKKIKENFIESWIDGNINNISCESFQDVHKRIKPIVDTMQKNPHNNLIIAHGIIFLAITKLLGNDIVLLKNTEIIQLG